MWDRPILFSSSVQCTMTQGNQWEPNVRKKRKLVSWFNLDLSLIGFFMTTKLQSGGYCIQWLVKIPLKKYMKIHFFSSRKKTKREFIEIETFVNSRLHCATHKVSPQCDWLDESSDDKLDWMTSRIQHICTVSLQCALTCDPSVCRPHWMICYI